MSRPKRIRAVTLRGMQRTVISLPLAMHRRLREISRTEGLVISESIRRAVAAWLEQRDQKRKERAR